MSPRTSARLAPRSMSGIANVLMGFRLSLEITGASAFPSFQTWIPNGQAVQISGVFWKGVGHVKKAGGGDLNAFGEAFLAAGSQWTEELCLADSDGDGQSNGVELGDPNCTWTPGATPDRTIDISMPACSDSYTAEVTFVANVQTNRCMEEALKEDISKHKVVAHAVLNIVAWAFLAPLAVLMKRFAPARLKEIKLLGWPLPFFLHFALMGLAVVFMIAAVMIAMTSFDKRAMYGHGAIGLLCFVGAVMQPLPAIFCRPDHGTERRKMFNIAHRGGGIITMLLAVVSLLLGAVNMGALWDKADETIALLVIIIALTCFVIGFVALQLLKPRAPQVNPAGAPQPEKVGVS